MRRATAIRLALAAMAGLGLNLALFEAFARLPVAVAVAAFGCYPLFVAAWEAACRRLAGGAVTVGMAAVAIAGLLLLIRPDRSVSASAAGVLLALLAAVLHAAYILLGRRGWDQVGDGAATFLIVATAALGLGAMAAATRPATVLTPASDLGLTGLLLLEGALAGAAAPLLFLAGLRRIGANPDRGAVAVRASRRHTARSGDVRPTARTLSASGRRAAPRRRHRRPARPARDGQGPPSPAAVKQPPPAATKRPHAARP